jgi:penicillin-binding protein 2
MACFVAVIVSGGRLVQFYFARTASVAFLIVFGIRPETIAAVKEGMRAVVAEGTGLRARLMTVEVCGKTGSAQVVAKSRLEKSPNAFEMQPHGWFVAFAPADDPRIALAVLVEHGKSGAGSAAPIARQILAEFFGVDRPAPPPAKTTLDKKAKN